MASAKNTKKRKRSQSPTAPKNRETARIWRALEKQGLAKKRQKGERLKITAYKIRRAKQAWALDVANGQAVGAKIPRGQKTALQWLGAKPIRGRVIVAPEDRALIEKFSGDRKSVAKLERAWVEARGGIAYPKKRVGVPDVIVTPKETPHATLVRMAMRRNNTYFEGHVGEKTGRPYNKDKAHRIFRVQTDTYLRYLLDTYSLDDWGDIIENEASLYLGQSG